MNYGEWDGDKGRSREKQTEIIHSDYIPCCLARESGMKNFLYIFFSELSENVRKEGK